jgi:molybdate/tungstate transport system ATP-binding protein
MLKLEGISKAWQGFELKDINLQIDNGEYAVVLGPTGAGKTLLLETIMGFHKPDKGKILLNDRCINETPPESRGIGYVPQNSMLFPHMTVKQNIEFGLRMRGIKEAQRKEKTEKIVGTLNLQPLKNKLPKTLSGGEKQKVALARVLVIEPTLILLDEPLSSVDVDAKRTLRDELKKANRELNVGVVHVTHDQTEAFSLAQQLAIMKNGQIVQVGSANEVFSNPKDEFVARFLGYENIFEAKLKKTSGAISLWDLEGLVVKAAGEARNETGLIALRPEDVLLYKTQPSIDDENIVKGIIEDYTDLGPVIVVTVNVGPLMKAVITKRSFLEMQLDRNKEVWLAFDAKSLKFLE